MSEMLERVLEAHAEGITAKQALVRLGVSYPTLRKWAQRGAVEFPRHNGTRPESAQKAELHAKEIAKLPKLTSDALRIGKAGEHLVCADLLAQGYDAFLADQGLPFDVVLIHNSQLLRLQVKTSARPVNSNAGGRVANFVYNFTPRRRGKNGVGAALSGKHCDIVALVGLSHRAIAYFRTEEVRQTVALHPPGYEFPGAFRRSRTVSIDGFPIKGLLA